ncbi:unnamed protein product [Urochloa humidicola]
MEPCSVPQPDPPTTSGGQIQDVTAAAPIAYRGDSTSISSTPPSMLKHSSAEEIHGMAACAKVADGAFHCHPPHTTFQRHHPADGPRIPDNDARFGHNNRRCRASDPRRRCSNSGFQCNESPSGIRSHKPQWAQRRDAREHVSAINRQRGSRCTTKVVKEGITLGYRMHIIDTQGCVLGCHYCCY